MRRSGNVGMHRDREVVPFAVGDVVTMRKPHPCGGSTWEVRRVGADLGLVCRTCGRRIMMDRFEVQRMMVRRVPGNVESDADIELSAASGVDSSNRQIRSKVISQ